jgi:hypothetical protein
MKVIVKRGLRVLVVASLAWAVVGSLWARYAQPDAAQMALSEKTRGYRDSSAP